MALKFSGASVCAIACVSAMVVSSAISGPPGYTIAIGDSDAGTASDGDCLGGVQRGANNQAIGPRSPRPPPPPAGVPHVSVPSVLIFCKELAAGGAVFGLDAAQRGHAGAGSLALPNVPLVMLEALVVSVVALAAKPEICAAE